MATQSTKDTAKEEARSVAHDGVEGGKHVAAVGADQAKQVASEAGHQAKALLGQAQSELVDHASSQQNRVADQLHSLSHELGSMASKSDEEGLAKDLAQPASQPAPAPAHWLSGARSRATSQRGEGLRPSQAGHVPSPSRPASACSPAG